MPQQMCLNVKVCTLYITTRNCQLQQLKYLIYLFPNVIAIPGNKKKHFMENFKFPKGLSEAAKSKKYRQYYHHKKNDKSIKNGIL